MLFHINLYIFRIFEHQNKPQRGKDRTAVKADPHSKSDTRGSPKTGCCRKTGYMSLSCHDDGSHSKKTDSADNLCAKSCSISDSCPIRIYMDKIARHHNQSCPHTDDHMCFYTCHPFLHSTVNTDQTSKKHRKNQPKQRRSHI